MAEALRDWRSDVVYTTNEYGATVPVDSSPMENENDWDVFRKFYLRDKFENGKGLNGTEKERLSHVCSISAYQTIQCYGPVDYYGHGFSVAELQIYCSKCPYAQKFGRYNYGINWSIWFPDFVEIYLKDRNKERDFEKKSKWFVYFVTDGEYVKIGKGSDTNDRISQLQTGNPRKITLMFKIYLNNKDDAYDLEGYLHNTYSQYQAVGEWFDIYNKLNIEAWKRSFITEDNINEIS